MPHNASNFSLLSDEELMFCLRNGEVLAFDELYFRYNKRLLGYFIRMLNFDKALAEDALQDLFLKIAEAPEKFDTSRSFKTWIFSVASNSCKNFYRHKKIVLECNEEIKYINGNVSDSVFLNTASKMDATIFRKMLEEVLNEMSAEKKEAFILKYQEEKTISEIALIQGCPEGSVKSRLHYTIKVLEEKLKIFKPVNY
ncbi:MAG: sigma-70 family RNA polymerase sigma factor [Bacteroidota bacterium]|nr:sigma-70 family RNA polymerase sigma factor [Bacteroidota bacterium]